MQIGAIGNLSPAASLVQTTGGPSRDFDAMLSHATKAREAAQQLVSSAFILPMLQMMRDDPLRAELIHGGTAEDLFGQKLDTIIADNIVHQSNFPLVDAVYDRIMQRAHPAGGLNVHG